MKKPLIGLTPGHDADTQNTVMRPTYLKALEASGAIPLVLPLKASPDDYRQLAENLDGFVFTGGPDPHPFLWGEETHKNCGPISVKRDQMELTLLSIAMEQKKPILGICRGAQMLNIGLGGDIYQDIDSQYRSAFPIAHTQPLHYRHPSHHVDVKKNTLLASFGDDTSIQVNSCHHQAIRNLAPGLIPGGVASDGIVEEIELPDYPFLIGVQWHPEYLWETDSCARNLFQAFVDACKK